MDGKTFDAIIRRALREVGRRGVLRAGFGALAASGLAVLGLGLAPDAEADLKKRRQKYRQKRRRRRQRDRRNPDVPPPPPPPTDICAGKVSCPPDRCCDQCCDPITGTGDLGRCAGPVGEDKCCSAAGGGGFCGVDDRCCPPGPNAELGACGPDGAPCCPAGGWRNDDFPNCCAAGSATFNCPFGTVCCSAAIVGPNGGCCDDDFPVCCAPDDGGGCCAAGKVCCPSDKGEGCCPTLLECCAVDDDCADPTPDCVNGCCGIAPMAAALASSRRRPQAKASSARAGDDRKRTR